MIADDLKNPPKFLVSAEEMNNLQDFLESKNENLSSNSEINLNLSRKQWNIIISLVPSLLFLQEVLKIRNVGVRIIRKIFNIQLEAVSSSNDDDNDDDDDKDIIEVTSNSSITSDAISDNQKESSDDKESDSSSDINIDNLKDGTDDGEIDEIKSDKKGINQGHNGRRGASDVINPIIIEHNHPSLGHGDHCPEKLCNGRVYLFKRDGKPRTVISFTFEQPFKPIVNQFNDLRCNLCKKFFKVFFPEKMIRDGANENRYLYPAQVALLILHYCMGFPFYRLDQFQSLVGERFPESTQFANCLKAANKIEPLLELFKKLASKAFLIQGDDVATRVLDLTPELRERRSDGAATLREGVHTSILIATTNEGHHIPILKTGIIHFGEHLDEILKLRPTNLNEIIVVSDCSKVNKSYIDKIKVIQSGCLQHLRDYFVKAKKSFQNESGFILNKIKKIFAFDKKTIKMTAEDRFEFLKENALPLLDQIKAKVDDLLNKKVALPKSELGTALSYFKNHYHKFTVPYKYQGIPIHNNFSEWCTYYSVRLLANSKFYKNEKGARVGDIVQSVVLSCCLANINPYEFILHCLRNYKELEKFPEKFLPWNLKETVPGIQNHKKMNFTGPEPPLSGQHNNKIN